MNVRIPHLCATGILLLAVSCVSAPPPDSSARTSRTDSAPASTTSRVGADPAWAGQASSWSKLTAIERWLAGSESRAQPELQRRAHLELGEGRLALAQRERKEIPPAVLAYRLHGAEVDFGVVLADAKATPLERQRGERGLAEIRTLRGASPAPAAIASSPGGLGIQERSVWRPAPEIRGRLNHVTGPYTRITVHHSARTVPEEIGRPSLENVVHAIQGIQKVHMRDEGYGDIGYHFLIDPEGRIWQGRALEWQGAHASGANNVGNIGICLFGNFNVERPDARALASLERLTDSLCERSNIPRSRVFGHRQLRGTECPGDTLMAWVARFSSGATH